MAIKHICIVTQSHLCRNPRVLKEALTLAEAKFRVTIVNSTYSAALAAEDIGLINTHDIKIEPVSALEKGGFRAFKDKLIKKIGDKMVRVFGVQTPMALGYGAGRFVNAALKPNADLYICHQETGLYAGVKLIGKGKQVAFDFEDWYSEDLSEEARLERPIGLLKRLEKTALQKGVFCFTTSDVMAAKLAETYDAPIPATLYNTFGVDESLLTIPKRYTPPVKLFWFSQTIGPGRGLEEFIGLMSQIETRLELHLLGAVSESYKNELSNIQHTHPILFHPLVSNEKLPAKIAEFDVGLALELDKPLNRDHTVTNKLFQYIVSGLPVIATNTKGQQEVIGKYGGGVLIDMKDTDTTLPQLRELLNNPAQLLELRQQAIYAASQLDWENEKGKILNKINQLQITID
ncbi:glycosyltransferase [Mucilaginibacter sp.]|jgi:glycosyltransferase involved in cell wall biosynthesis|uniref:glycosyltransferase n=1 Tax=Mucilaginibacter sp. TaxID=1882438 RepID=UPI002B7A6322|nr:glycosyltransferase [Mucilaginibacter sp.]HTI60951.1 glycosyltransferase [Mucilaginibacter sp.]